MLLFLLQFHNPAVFLFFCLHCCCNRLLDLHDVLLFPFDIVFFLRRFFQHGAAFRFQFSRLFLKTADVLGKESILLGQICVI